MQAVYSSKEMMDILSECGFAVKESLGATEMTDQYFAEYNNNNPDHPMKAPDGVSYVFATR